MNLLNVQKILIVLCISALASCGGEPMTKPEAKTPTARQPKVAQTPSVNTAPSVKKNDTTATTSKPGSGGYYLDDGPGDNTPKDLDTIPDAKLKTEAPLVRANKPYSALGQKYTPMTKYVPYKKQGIASWYGKRFHGRKTSNGEVYDMYAMSGAHTTLPLPSYVKVTNPANGRSVIVKLNDRGPFKRDRLIDLSYAAAHKLKLISQGSGLVEVEAIDTSAEAMQKNASSSIANNSADKAQEVDSVISQNTAVPEVATSATKLISEAQASQVKSNQVKSNDEITASAATTTSLAYYVQAGAFKSEINGELLQKKIQGLALAENVGLANVYNNGLYRVKLGPYTSRNEADTSAANIRRQLNTAVIVTNQ